MSKIATATKTKFLQLTRVGSIFTITLGNGWKFSFDFNLFPDSIKAECGLHGCEQIFRDGVSGLSKELRYSEAEAFMQAKYDSFMAGEWSRKSQGLGYRLEDVINGLVAYKGMSHDQADGTIRNLSAEQIRAAMKKYPLFLAAVTRAAADRIQALAERQQEAGTSKDAEDELDALFGPEMDEDEADQLESDYHDEKEEDAA